MFQLLFLVLSIIFIVVTTGRLKIHPFLVLILAALLYGFTAGMPPGKIVHSINQGFGDTLGQIGILIVFGTIIGVFLDRSGGAYALAEKLLALTGTKNVAGAMSVIGYIISIPVFADSGFVVLSPLNKALCKRAGISLAGPAIALSIGLTVSHNLVPPTPGPIAAAGLLKADLGLVLMLGVPLSLLVLFCTWLFAVLVAGKTDIDPNPEPAPEDISTRPAQAPSCIRSVLPILVPIVLLILRSVALLPSAPFGNAGIREMIDFFGQPVIALLTGVLPAVFLPKKFNLSLLSTGGWVGKALINAALIILITGAGGSFGRVLRDSNIADTIGSLLSGAGPGIVLPFIIAAAVKTAQGSSTVALITTASIIAPILTPLGFETDAARALAVLAIGSGSMVASHANDSFFWVVTQMSNMNVPTGYKLHTLGTLVAGGSAIFFTWILSLFIL